MNNDIKQFILNLQSKDYSQANESLEKIIEKKITDRVKDSAKKVSKEDFFKSKKSVKKDTDKKDSDKKVSKEDFFKSKKSVKKA